MKPILKPGQRLPLRSGADPYALGWGALTKCENLRFDKGAYTARSPLTSLASSPGSGTCVGVSYLNSTAYIAMLSGGVVDVYTRAYTTSFGSTTTLTSSGKQLVDPDGLCSFGFFDYGSGDTAVVMQDGVSDPLIRRGGATERAITVEPPGKWAVKYRPAVIKAYSGSDTPNDDSNLEAQHGSTAVGGCWQFITTGAVTTSETAYFTFASSVDLSGTKQIWVLGDDGGIFRRAGSLNLTYASGDIELIGPTAIIPCGGGVAVYAYDVADENLGTVTGFEYTSDNLPSGATFSIYAICAGGVVPGGSSYAGTFMTANRNSESRLTVLESTPGDWNPNLNITNDVYIPLDSRLFYRPTVYRARPTQSGVTVGAIYRQELGESKFFLIDYEDLSASIRATFDDTVASEDRDTRYWAPSQYQVKVPVGRSYVAGGRHFVASGRSFWASEKDQPFHFNDVVPENTTYLDGAGQEFRLDSDENAVGVIAASSSIQGSPDIYAFSDKAVYRIFEDGRIIRISNVGCGAASSICEYRGRIWFLGADKQFYSLTGGLVNESRDRVDDVTLAMSDISRVSAAWKGDRMLAHTTGVQVFDGVLGDWEGKDLFGVTTVAIAPFLPGEVLFGGSDGALYNYGSTNNEGAYTCTLKTGALSAALAGVEEIRANQMRVLASSAIAMTTTRTDGAGNTAAGTIANTAATPMWRRDENTAKARAPGMDASVVSLTLAFAGGSGTKVYAWDIETSQGGTKADV